MNNTFYTLTDAAPPSPDAAKEIPQPVSKDFSGAKRDYRDIVNKLQPEISRLGEVFRQISDAFTNRPAEKSRSFDNFTLGISSHGKTWVAKELAKIWHDSEQCRRREELRRLRKIRRAAVQGAATPVPAARRIRIAKKPPT